ncbi:hypothetical protein GCK32_016221, partial [Trichostrongylus colubriformis]
KSATTAPTKAATTEPSTRLSTEVIVKEQDEHKTETVKSSEKTNYSNLPDALTFASSELENNTKIVVRSPTRGSKGSLRKSFESDKKAQPSSKRSTESDTG